MFVDQTSPRLSSTPDKSLNPLGLALISDFLEEHWPSMDLISDMLLSQLQETQSDRVNPTRIRPAFRTVFTRFPGCGSSSALRNFDRLANRQFFYPNQAKKLAAVFDVFHVVDHSYAHLVKSLPPRRTVVTCHDLDAFRCLIEPGRERRPLWFRIMTRHILDGLQQAAHVLFVTDTVRKAAIEAQIIDKQRTSVVPMGVHPSCLPWSDPVADETARRLLGSGPHINLLHVGSTIPRKRIDILLQVFSAVHNAVPSLRLLRVGGPFTPAQEQLADGLGVRASILQLPFLDRTVLAAVYRQSALLLQTSDSEGFGLPLVEAMACGCPVVASDLPVLREVGGSVADYCRVGDIDHWAETILRKISNSPENDGCRTTRRALFEHAAQFTWGAHAGKTAEIYCKIANS